jgi:hypothetical protein
MSKFMSSTGKTFISAKSDLGKVYRKKVTAFCAKYDGIGIDAQLFEEKIMNNKEGLIFWLEEDLVDWYKTNRKGKTIYAMRKGEYHISVADFLKKATKDTLNAKFGEQYFISADDLEKIK